MYPVIEEVPLRPHSVQLLASLCLHLVLSALSSTQMEKVRRRQVPAFGEWNYYYHYDVEPELPSAPEPEACSDVWFRYSPPPRKPASKKMRMPPPSQVASEKGRRRARDAGAPAKGASNCRVVRPVDEDLYQVPPPEFVSRRRKRAVKSFWMGCLGLNNCVA